MALDKLVDEAGTEGHSRLLTLRSAIRGHSPRDLSSEGPGEAGNE